MNIVNSIYGSRTTALINNAYFDCYGCIYEWNNNLSICFQLENEKILSLIEHKYEVIIANKFYNSFYMLDGSKFDRRSAVDKFKLHPELTYKLIDSENHQLLIVNDESLSIPKTASVIFSGNNCLLYQFNQKLFVLTDKLKVLDTYDLLKYKVSIIDEDIYFFNLIDLGFYFLNVDDLQCELIFIDTVRSDNDFKQDIHKIGELGKLCLNNAKI
ncbi:hypothetical protein [Marinicellulosiphila megalodicopiae]|uniref:hypothetical protein n=1 Tax=Marinicellulosiphila megalodicopiae TaxID=2724896 RepID=UPI003BAEE6D1